MLKHRGGTNIEAWQDTQAIFSSFNPVRHDRLQGKLSKEQRRRRRLQLSVYAPFMVIFWVAQLTVAENFFHGTTCATNTGFKFLQIFWL